MSFFRGKRSPLAALITRSVMATMAFRQRVRVCPETRPRNCGTGRKGEASGKTAHQFPEKLSESLPGSGVPELLSPRVRDHFRTGGVIMVVSMTITTTAE